jgi:hypothetical protein
MKGPYSSRVRVRKGEGVRTWDMLKRHTALEIAVYPHTRSVYRKSGGISYQWAGDLQRRSG